MKKFIYIAILLAGVGLTAFFLGRNSAGEVVVETPSSKPVRAVKRKPVKIPELNLPSLEYTMPAMDQLDEVTQKLVGFDDSISISDRNDVVWNLRKRNLRPEDFRAFYTFLKTNPEKDGPQLAWHSLKNDLMVFVIDDGHYKESTAQLMMDIINDPEQHEVMREYTLQYTTDFFERHWVNRSPARDLEPKELSSTDQKLQDAMLKTMWNMLDSAEGPIAGTSLIRLNELGEYIPNISQAKIDKETERMALENFIPVSSRMAALSVATERKMHHLKDQIADIAFDESVSVSLRMSALHSVSTMEPGEEFIERLSKDLINNQKANKLVKRAAELALKKLQKTRG